MSTGGGDGGGIEQRAAICHGGTDAGIGGKDGGDQRAVLAQAGIAQLLGIAGQPADVVPVDQLRA